MKTRKKPNADADSDDGRVRAGVGTFHPGEREADAIRNAKQNVQLAQTSGQVAKDALRYLENCLWTIIPTDKTPELQKLMDRVQDLQRTLNGMELGAFMIRVQNAMDEAYRRLP